MIYPHIDQAKKLLHLRLFRHKRINWYADVPLVSNIACFEILAVN